MKNRNKQVSVLFMLLGTLFCVCLITANVLETKQIAFGSLTITGGLLVFPLSYIINDCVCEVWGFDRAKLLIWLGFAMNFLFVAFGVFTDMLPGAPYWNNDEGFHSIFGLAARITSASFIAFLAGSFINAYVMCRLKKKEGVGGSNGGVASDGDTVSARHFSFRAVVSTLLGETADSLIFFPIAFLGVIAIGDMVWLMLSQVAFKTMYEILVLPLTIRVVRMIKKYESE